MVQIDQLYIVAGPAEPGAYNEEEEDARKQATKQAKLAKLEEEWKAEQQTSKGWWWWSPLSISLPSNVIANLQVGDSPYEMSHAHYWLLCFAQVIVNDVHIRYEDRDAVPGRPFSVGVLLENISAQSTDENWVRCITHALAINRHDLGWW